jgi:predicted extracellular nuclease
VFAAGTIALVAPSPASAVAPPGATVFISEIHYDNVGTDAGEAVEIFGPAGTDLSTWSIVLYNGNVPAAAVTYDSDALTGTIPDLGSGFGVVILSYPSNGIQNGTADGIALVEGTTVRQLLSYEGTFTASNGPAAGLTSTDIGVAEAGTEAAGQSLQLIGTGTTYGSLTWQGPNTSSFGAINTGSVAPPPPGGDNCPNSPTVTRIDQVQGSVETSPCVGETVLIDGVVVGDYEGPSPALRGFYVQEDDADADADPATSEGVFVFNGADTDLVSVGNRVSVSGTVSEFQGQTQISAGTVTVLAPSATVTPAAPALPMTSATAFERFEGMQVTFAQTLTVTEMFQLARFGQVMVSTGKLDQPTQVVAPGAAAVALQAANDLDQMFIDDTQNGQNPDPIVLGRGGNPLSASNTLRGGDTVTGASGVLTYTWAGNAASGNAWRLRPVSPAAGGFPFVAANVRPTAAPAVGGSLRVIGANVLNYFLTLDSGSSTACGPTGFQQACRGAETVQEFQRQRAKLLQALTGLQADVLGLAELENSPSVDTVGDIVAGLNAIEGPGTYAAIATGVIGTDTIRVGMIYRTAAVAPVGTFAVLTSSVDPDFAANNRPALAQTFQQTGSGERFTVVMNHLKSKGSCPTSGVDADQLDGQACWNHTRTLAAQALVDWLATDPTGSGDPDVLLLGDYNSYGQEDPMQVFAANGYVDLADHFGTPYSYVFDGQWGTLDYAIASPSLLAQVAGATEHHINSDEPNALDYNTNFKSAGQVASLFSPDQYRVSDHDPLVVGLQLGVVTPPAEVPEAPVTVLLGLSAGAMLALAGAHGRRSRRVPVGRS